MPADLLGHELVMSGLLTINIVHALQWAYLGGMYDADGSISIRVNDTRLRIAIELRQSNPAFLSGCVHFLAGHNIKATISEDTSATDKGKYSHGRKPHTMRVRLAIAIYVRAYLWAIPVEIACLRSWWR